jgi:hypothetical protein
MHPGMAEGRWIMANGFADERHDRNADLVNGDITASRNTFSALVDDWAVPRPRPIAPCRRVGGSAGRLANDWEQPFGSLLHAAPNPDEAALEFQGDSGTTDVLVGTATEDVTDPKDEASANPERESMSDSRGEWRGSRSDQAGGIVRALPSLIPTQVSRDPEVRVTLVEPTVANPGDGPRANRAEVAADASPSEVRRISRRADGEEEESTSGSRPKTRPRRSRVEALVLAAVFLLGGLSVALLNRVLPNDATAAAIVELTETLKADRAAYAKQLEEIRALVLSKPAEEPKATEVKLAEGALDPLRRDLSDVKDGLASLTRSTSAASGLDAKLVALSNRVDRVAAEVQKVPDAIIKHEAKRFPYGDASGSTSGTSMSPAAATLLYERGVSLFNQVNFLDADACFHACRLLDPEDARFWYYGALTRGFVGGNWAGDATKLAAQGVERERARPDKAATIDEALASLSPTGGGTWLASFRKGTKPR